ncbi:galactokinase [Sorangium cellulosum]|uniref:Galactokinase n=1 Tax=Sorangium cellulosum TaxID=56 RepID=A0A2L0EZH2_SORCE|nr:galactokinase [Sorangium cellulosum]AUX44704.1 galactokinase [Sorangium cellulosum]
MTTAGKGQAFEAIFGRPAKLRAEAPGRVNLIGEHTDYSGGYVLPTAIPQKTRVEVAPRDDGLIEVATLNVGSVNGGARLSYRAGEEARRGLWLDYVQGITAMLRARGVAVPGFDARIESTVPLGSGLSSSASLLVALGRALRALIGLSIDDVEIARLAHAAEFDFVGAPVGMMDQMASSLADENTALFLDTRTLAFERIPLPAEAELLVVNSGVAHQHASGDYKARRAECERSAELLGVPQLRDVDVSVEPRIASLPAPLDRRARHVVTENARVLAAVAALRAGDLAELGRLFDASHRSMRDDFEVSVPAVDALVESARAQPDVYGARLTGGGFGGSIVALVKRGSAAKVGQAVVADYARTPGRRATLLVGGPSS